MIFTSSLIRSSLITLNCIQNREWWLQRRNSLWGLSPQLQWSCCSHTFGGREGRQPNQYSFRTSFYLFTAVRVPMGFRTSPQQSSGNDLPYDRQFLLKTGLIRLFKHIFSMTKIYICCKIRWTKSFIYLFKNHFRKTLKLLWLRIGLEFK